MNVSRILLWIIMQKIEYCFVALSIIVKPKYMYGNITKVNVAVLTETLSILPKICEATRIPSHVQRTNQLESKVNDEWMPLQKDQFMYAKTQIWKNESNANDDDVIKWKHFPRYWPFVWGIHRWPVNSPHKGQWRGALMFSFICAWINGCVNTSEAGDLRRDRADYDVTVTRKQNVSFEILALEDKRHWMQSCHRANFVVRVGSALQWRHNGRNGGSNHQPHDCLLNRLFRHRSKKIPKLSVTGLCEGS